MDDFGMLGESGSMILSVASGGFAALVGLALQIALLAVVLTVVKRHRRDALPWLLAAAVLGLVGMVLGPALGWAGTLLAGELGIGAMLVAQSALGIVGTIAHAVTFALLLRGIVALARPAA